MATSSLEQDFANSNKSLSSFNQQTDSYEEQPRFSILDHQDLSFDQVLDVLLPYKDSLANTSLPNTNRINRV